MRSTLNIAIIGAGPAGLVSAKYAIAHGHNVTIYERSESLGGLWSSQTGTNKYGLNVHTSIYKELRTNVPNQLMEFPDFQQSNDGTTVSFPSQSMVLNLLESYATHFNLNKCINYNCSVVRVVPIENEKWKIIANDLPTRTYITQIYDAIFVCNGHFSAPFIPEIDGASHFAGKMIHSRDFRTAETFRDENVLVIGGSVSGLDLVISLSNVVKSLTLSVKKRPNDTEELRKKRQQTLPAKTILKYNVQRFTADGAEFIDGTRQTFTAVIFATGYKYSYPFLSNECGINIEENFVQPLYKQIFNINHPTMVFIGIPYSTNTFRLLDLQVRFVMKFLNGDKKLPTKLEMLRILRFDTQSHWRRGFSKCKTHFIVPVQSDYQNQLAEIGDIEKIPDVYLNIAFDALLTMQQQPNELRKFKYSIVDNDTFIKAKFYD